MTAIASVAAQAARPVRAERLRGSSDVRRVFATRRAAGRGPVVVHARDRGDAGAPRLTVVAGRGVGNAVVRNRVKRRLRAAAYTAGLRDGFDYVVVGRPAAATEPPAQLAAAVHRAVAEASQR